MEPCGTPHLMFSNDDIFPLIPQHCTRSQKTLKIHVPSLKPIPIQLFKQNLIINCVKGVFDVQKYHRIHPALVYV